MPDKLAARQQRTARGAKAGGGEGVGSGVLNEEVRADTKLRCDLSVKTASTSLLRLLNVERLDPLCEQFTRQNHLHLGKS